MEPGRASAHRTDAEQAMTRDEERRQNRRTALILLSVALVFFAGVIARHWLYGG
jgi:hypothetical protein